MTQESKHSQSSNNSETNQEKKLNNTITKKSNLELELMKEVDTIENMLMRGVTLSEILEDKKIWEPVRAELVKGLNAKTHSNPGQFVKRVREHGAGLRYGYPEQDENKPKEDGPKNRLPFDRVEQELGKLYKYLNNPSNNDAIQADPKAEQLKNANESITRTLRDDLGIDLNRYSNAD